MGKGGGCVPSRKKAPPLTSNLPQSSPPQIHAPPIDSNSDGEKLNSNLEIVNPQSIVKLKLFIVFYSMYGHVEALAMRIKKGVDVVEGVEGYLFRVPETFSDDVLKKMQSPPKNPNIPIISAAELVDADGFLFGFPTRYGSMAAQMKAFFDSTGKLWTEQALAGKPAGFFVSTGTQGGGQETTAWTAITQLAHHGMMFVPIGYTFGSGMFKMDSIRGGSPYGCGVFAGDGKREASDVELDLAEHQGTYMASILKRLHS